MTDQTKKEPTLDDLLGGAKPPNAQAAATSQTSTPTPAPSEQPSPKTETTAGQAVQQPSQFKPPEPDAAVRGPAQQPPGLTTLTVVAVDQNGNNIPAGAFYAAVEEFTGIGWNHLHEVRISSLPVKVELLRDRRLVITQQGDV